MSLINLLCILVLQAPPALENTAQVTGVVGDVRTTREGRETAVVPKSALQVGDVVSTGPDAGAILYWRSGITVYMGANSRIELGDAAPVTKLNLGSGEVRITAGNTNGLILLTPQAEARLSRGILRAAVTPKGERFWSESGTASIRMRELEARRKLPRRQILTAGSHTVVEPVPTESNSTVVRVAGTRQEAAPERPVIQLKPGEQITILPGGSVQKATRGDAADWELDIEKLKRAASANASRAYRDSVAQESLNRSNTDAPPTDAPDGTTNANQTTTNSSTQVSTSSGVNLSLGNVLASSAAGSAGGLFTDANQNTLSGKLTTPYQNLPAGSTFAGNIHLLTGQTTYTLSDVNLTMRDGFLGNQAPGSPAGPQFWSVGLGALPTGQITTGIGTGTGLNPDAIRIHGFNAYVVRLDQFGIPDPASPNPPPGQTFAVPGLVGQTPVNPNIQGAVPLKDTTAQFNQNATFALGQIALGKTVDNHPQVILRRSDQDRRIIKDPGGNDNLDQVTANPDVTGFSNVSDPLFFPSLPTVKVPDRGPNALRNLPEYRHQHALQRAAITTVTAEGLAGYAKRTGQTRFVIDGKIIDISGYKPR